MRTREFSPGLVEENSNDADPEVEGEWDAAGDVREVNLFLERRMLIDDMPAALELTNETQGQSPQTRVSVWY